MKIERVGIERVKPWAKNPRGIKRDDFERLKKQIRDLGEYKPLLCYEEGGEYVVLGGNMRLRAYRELGVKEVDISIVEAPSEARKIQFALSDNDRAGFYEEDKLAELVLPEVPNLDLSQFKVDIGEPWMDLKKILAAFGPDPTAAVDQWVGMPEYKQEDLTAYRHIIVNFNNPDDVAKFAELLGQNITEKTRFLWFPKAEIDKVKDLRFKANES